MAGVADWTPGEVRVVEALKDGLSRADGSSRGFGPIGRWNPMHCEKLDKCPFFMGKMQQMPAMAELMKKEYCLGDKRQCARYNISKAGLVVPGDLYPNDFDRASKVLSSQ
jgi:hypothetical protein